MKKENCAPHPIHADIVSIIKEKMPDSQSVNDLALLFKLFADQTRASILILLEHGEVCVCDIASILNMSKSAISHQLKFLKIGNLVKSRREGKVVFYSLADDHVKNIISCGLEHVNE